MAAKMLFVVFLSGIRTDKEFDDKNAAVGYLTAKAIDGEYEIREVYVIGDGETANKALEDQSEEPKKEEEPKGEEGPKIEKEDTHHP